MRALDVICRALLCATLATMSHALAAPAQSVAIIGARAVTMTDAGTIEGATILIRDGRIIAVGSNLRLPSDARVVDARGGIVTPGLMNAATQLGIVEVHSGAADQTVTQGPFGAAFDIQYAINPNSIAYDVARADGLTRAIAIPGGSAEAPFSGIGASLRLSPGTNIVDRVRAGAFVSIGGLSAVSVGGSRSAQWMLIRNALDEADRCKANARACRKSEEGDSLARLNREAMIAVVERRMPLAISVARESDIRQAVQLAQDYSIRVILYGAAEAWRVADLLAQRKIPVVIDTFQNTPSTFDEIGARQDNAALLHRAGVLIAFAIPGTHATHNAGTMVREAAGIAVASGLPWLEALKAITVNPASIWSMNDHYGSIAAGKEADLVIWDGDPLEPSSTPLAVWVAGDQVGLGTRQIELARRYLPDRGPWPAAYSQHGSANQAQQR